MGEWYKDLYRVLLKRPVVFGTVSGIVVVAVVVVVLTNGSNGGTVQLSTAGTAIGSSSTTLSNSATTAPNPDATPTTAPTTVPAVTTTVPFATTPPTVTTPFPVLTAPPTTPLPATTPPTTIPPTTTPVNASSPGGVLTGTVVDSSGRPVAGAYVIGLETLTVAQTDAAGQFMMSCQVSVNGISGNRAEPLVAGTWLLPVQPTGQGSYGYGRNTTSYTPPPTAAGLGYAFSGGAPDAASASIVSCGGPPPHFVLPPGGGVDIEFVDSSGAPTDNPSPSPPVDNLYLPGLGDHAGLETAPLSGGHQILQQLGAGTLRIDATMTDLLCQGPGVLTTSNVVIVNVTIAPGATTKVVCRAQPLTGQSNVTTPA